MRSIGWFGAGWLTLLAGGSAAAELPVDLELILAVDVSGSMDAGEQALQRQGYIEAFLHPELAAAVRSGPYGRIVVTYVEWGGHHAQQVTVPWTLIDGGSAADAFAADLAEAPPARLRGTSISGVLLFAAPLFEGNGFDGLRRVIDISGDGPNNIGPPVVPARDAALAAGIVVNGLPLELDARNPIGMGRRSLADYYRDCVIGGPGAFVLPVTATDQMREAIRRKLVLEIAGLPARLVPAAETGPSAGADCLVGERIRRDWLRDP